MDYIISNILELMFDFFAQTALAFKVAWFYGPVQASHVHPVPWFCKLQNKLRAVVGEFWSDFLRQGLDAAFAWIVAFLIASMMLHKHGLHLEEIRMKLLTRIAETGCPEVFLFHPLWHVEFCLVFVVTFGLVECCFPTLTSDGAPIVGHAQCCWQGRRFLRCWSWKICSCNHY